MPNDKDCYTYVTVPPFAVYGGLVLLVQVYFGEDRGVRCDVSRLLS